MWFDDSLAQRVGQSRVREIENSGANTVAVSCPFCLIMLGDGLAATSKVEVRDIAELLADAVLGPESPNDRAASNTQSGDGPSNSGDDD
jgi:Fe-S oxidoreductase